MSISSVRQPRHTLIQVVLLSYYVDNLGQVEGRLSRVPEEKERVNLVYFSVFLFVVCLFIRLLWNISVVRLSSFKSTNNIQKNHKRVSTLIVVLLSY